MVNAPETHKIRHVSTGRGGAANFKKATSLAKKQSEAAVVIDSQAGDVGDCALTRIATQASLGARFATGRGGAGNILPTGQAPLPAQTEPLSSRPRTSFTTGRGGAGNFKSQGKTKQRAMSLEAAAATRVLQSSNEPSSSSSTTSRGTGRPKFASRVPRIDADFESDCAVDEEEGWRGPKSRSDSFSSAKSAPAAISLFGKMRRRLSSFGTALE